MNIWEQLVASSTEDPRASFKLQYNLVLKVNDTFYRAKAVCPISARQIQVLEELRLKLEKEPPVAEKTEYDLQLRATAAIDENGDGKTKLDPVNVEEE